MAIWKTLIIGGKQIKSFKTGTTEWLGTYNEIIIFDKDNAINLPFSSVQNDLITDSKVLITKTTGAVEEFVIVSVTIGVSTVALKSSLGTLTQLSYTNGTWESGSFVSGTIKKIVLEKDLSPRYAAIATTAPADIATWFNANGQTLSTTVNENTFTANFKIVANLADGTTKTWNRIGAYFNSEPHTFYPTNEFVNTHELISHPATVWGSYNKWTYFPAGTGSPNDAGRTGIVINSFEIIKIV